MRDEKLPEPPVSPDLDVRHLPWMRWDAGFVDSPAFLLASGDELKAHVALCFRAWAQVPAASLPDDERMLAALSGAGRRWPRVKAAALSGFFLCSDGRLYHADLAARALEAWELSDAQRKRAAKRWQSRGNAGAYARAMPRRDETGRDETRVVAGTASAMPGRLPLDSPEGSPKEGEVVGTIPLIDGTEFEICNGAVVEFEAAYPRVDVPQTIKEIRAWSISNPERRASRDGALRFVNRWLAREQNGTLKP